jgi:DNA polymerase-3 subunit epsilon
MRALPTAVAIPILVAVLALASYAVSAVALWQAVRAGGPVGGYMSIAFLIVAVLAGIAAGLLYVRLSKPMATLARELRLHAQTSSNRPIATAPGHMLDGLPAAAERVLAALNAARGETAAAVDAATRRAEEQKSRLEAILLDLAEGVIVCNLEHRILLYNQSAARILEMGDALGLARSLFGVLKREPVVLTLELLLRQADGAQEQGDESRGEAAADTATHRLVCATADLRTLLQARLSLIREPSGVASGYVLTFADVGAELEGVVQRDTLLREVATEWRRPLASLRAATEMLTGQPPPEPAERRMFEDIIAKEVAALGGRFAEVAQRYERLTTGSWPLADIHSLDLFLAIQKHLADIDGIEVTPVGVPAWIHADVHSLVLALEFLIRSIARETQRTAFDIGAAARGEYVYVEVVWDGAPVMSATIDAWLAEPLKGTIGNRTLRHIVERHHGEVWSQALAEGRTCLRLPLKAAMRSRPHVRSDRMVPMPELYDFDLFDVSHTESKDTPVRKMNLVVFDTETTGLRPNEGDALLSIGAVRVVNGRILTGETFERLVNPGRDIPASSTRIHGITAEMVRDKPPAHVVLPQFKSFVGDAVLVAYNAAFDMRFLENAAEAAGVSFSNPVLDALFLAAYLQQDATDLSLSATADRLGVDVIGRHTALGDAMTTAAIFVKLIDLLKERGIETLGQAAGISSRMMELQRRRAQHC